MRKLAYCLVIAALTAYGQRRGIENIDAEKPEGKLLQEIMQESDAPKKTALLEQFIQQFPKHEHAPWVLESLQGIYLKSDQPDKALAAGEKLLALEPDDQEAALQNVKAAEAKKDPAAILKWSATASANARKAAAAPKPKEEDAVAEWKSEVEYARQVDQYSEYALYKAALESRDPKTTVALLESLEERSPKSEYLLKSADALFTAYRQTNATAKALALAERTLAVEQNNEDMLLLVADSYLQNKKETQKIPVYTARVVALMAQKPKPEGVSDADWNKRKNLVLGLAHYMSGKQYYLDSQFGKADQELRAALPLVETSPAVKPEVLYLLGFANYKLEKPQEAANFYRSCAAIASPFQATAAKNLQGIRAQYQGIK